MEPCLLPKWSVPFVKTREKKTTPNVHHSLEPADSWIAFHQRVVVVDTVDFRSLHTTEEVVPSDSCSRHPYRRAHCSSDCLRRHRRVLEDSCWTWALEYRREKHMTGYHCSYSEVVVDSLGRNRSARRTEVGSRQHLNFRMGIRSWLVECVNWL